MSRDPRVGLLAQSLDRERRSRRESSSTHGASNFGAGIGGRTPMPVRPGIDPAHQIQGGPAESDDFTDGVGGPAATPQRPGMNPPNRFPPERKGGNRRTGRARGRRPPDRAQEPDSDDQIGMPESPTARY